MRRFATLLPIVALVLASVAVAAPAAAEPPQQKKTATPKASKPPKPPKPPKPTKPPKPPARIDRGYVVGGGGVNLTPTSFTDVVQPIEFGEPASVESRFRFGSAATLDVGGAYHIRRRWWAGLAVTHFGRSGRDDVSAQVPHPFVFNRPRAVTGEASLDRSETGVHFQAIWTHPIPIRALRKWQGSLSGGPSILHVGQELVSDITVMQTYPYDAATFATAVSARGSGTHLGFNLGAAGDYAATRRVAIRVSLAFAYAPVTLEASGSHTVKVSAGGLRLGGGVLYRF
jgi:hypothetical protein